MLRGSWKLSPSLYTISRPPAWSSYTIKPAGFGSAVRGRRRGMEPSRRPRHLAPLTDHLATVERAIWLLGISLQHPGARHDIVEAERRHQGFHIGRYGHRSHRSPTRVEHLRCQATHPARATCGSFGSNSRKFGSPTLLTLPMRVSYGWQATEGCPPKRASAKVDHATFRPPASPFGHLKCASALTVSRE